MKLGTKIACGVGMSIIIFSSSYAIRVPKLESDIQALEQKVDKLKIEKDEMGNELITLKNSKYKLISYNNLLSDKNSKFKEEISVLENKLTREKLNTKKKHNELILLRQKDNEAKVEVKEKKVEPRKISIDNKESSSKEMSGFEVTYYNDYGATKSGRTTAKGITAAVDPDVIPLGTWIKIVFEDGTAYTRRADDTGGAVKGKIVDLYMPESDRSLEIRGREKNVKVYILEDM